MNIIAISGHAQSGKDTVASILQHKLEHSGNRVLVTHYADLLKYICKTFFGWNGLKDERGRHLLQYIGTDVVREADPDFWVNFVLQILRIFSDQWDWVIIPDARFPNEIERPKAEGHNVTHVRVKRNMTSDLTASQLCHASETSLDDVIPDYLVINDGDITDLDGLVTNIIEEINNGDK